MASAMLTLENHGQPITVTIHGRVVDEFGEGVSDAGVTVLQGEQVLKNAVSDEHGEFEVNKLETKTGFHKVRAAKRGWRPTDEEFLVTKETEGKSIVLVLRLQTEEELLERDHSRAETMDDLFEEEKIVEEDEEEEKVDKGPYGCGAGDDEIKYEVVRVFFATDRNRQLQRGKVDPKKFFGNDRSPDSAISFGYCDVSIPAEHVIGNIERPSIFQLYIEQPDKHSVLLKLEMLVEDHFFQSVEAKASKTADVVFFVHGYHVTFPEAIRRTAQIASDLSFGGTPICYSWPSAGKYSGYPADEASVEWTIPHLLEVLRKTASLPKVNTIHLIAHSMGNRALVRCLEQISTAFTTDAKSRIHQVVLAAPDVDAGVFVNSAEKIIPAAKHITMYASSHDLPLKMSKQFHNYPRAGETGDNITIVPNIDTVDASTVLCDILGHSYFGVSRTVLSDIHVLFEDGKLPPRFGLKQAMYNGKLFWVFVP